jgi:hypothetical protein
VIRQGPHFALAAGHRRIAISRFAGTLNFHCGLLDRSAFIRRLDGTQPDGFTGDLVNVPDDRLLRFGLLGHAADYRPGSWYVQSVGMTHKKAAQANWAAVPPISDAP